MPMLLRLCKILLKIIELNELLRGSLKCRVPRLFEYREQGHNDVLKINAKQNEFATDHAEKYQHIIRISGLKGNTTYEYRINDGKDYTAWETFNTDNGIRTKALIFPDSQSVDYGTWARTVKMAWGKKS